jgi:PBP1b-binding outer membrane lipoprotein LpoB
MKHKNNSILFIAFALLLNGCQEKQETSTSKSDNSNNSEVTHSGRTLGNAEPGNKGIICFYRN